MVDATCGIQPADADLIEAFKQREIPYVVAFNKADALSENERTNFLVSSPESTHSLEKRAHTSADVTRPVAEYEILLSAQTSIGI